MSKPVATTAPERPHPRGLGRSPWDRAALIVFGLVGLFVVSTFRDYGMAWDEPDHDGYGGRIIGYYLGLVRGEPDRTAITKGNLYLYGGAFDVATRVFVRIAPFDRYDARHLFTALVALVGAMGVWKLAREVGGPRAAFLAVLLLFLTPRYYGHMFHNPKDIPFAAGCAWSLAYILMTVRHLPQVPIHLIVKLGIALGLTLGVRVGGVILIFYLFVAVVLESRARESVRWSNAMLPSALAILIAWGVMLLFWPWAQLAAVSNPLEALRAASSFDWTLPVLFRGESVSAPELPRHYLPWFLLITLPEVTLLGLFVAGVIGFLVARRKGPQAILDDRHVLVVALAGVFPIVYAAAFRPVLYDGVRHFLFILPPLTIVAAMGIESLWNRLGLVPRRAALVFVSGWLIVHLSLLVRLHPYQYVYFNALVGGLPGADGSYETDYWGASYREAVSKLDGWLDEAERQATQTVFDVRTCSDPLLSSYYFSDRLRLASFPQEADFFLATTRWQCDRSVEGRVIARVERLGVVLAVVKDLRKPRAPGG